MDLGRHRLTQIHRPNALRAGAILIYSSTNPKDLRLAYNSLISIVLARYANPVEVWLFAIHIYHSD